MKDKLRKEYGKNRDGRDGMEIIENEEEKIESGQTVCEQCGAKQEEGEVAERRKNWNILREFFYR